MDPTRPPESAAKELKAENKRLSSQFKAQHALLVAFFTLLLSECGVLPFSNTGVSANEYAAGNREVGCWHPKSFNKAVVILVDALRYDFTVPSRLSAGENGQSRHFHDALPVLYETALREPHNAFLRPFIADPPTTTLQRLKGLTTGTLPTFIDAGSNFAGTAIDEDNLIEQLYLAGKKVVHLGDDTWHSLFPGYFEPNLTRAYDSFNVWDLHTVDNGVNEHLFPLLEPAMTERWDVLIGHYLGVDHAGHRYGPDHPAMADKLKQMDATIRHMIEAIDDETLLVVMGDHGMDVKGDHGGESDDEVEAALWMYSRRGIFGRSDERFVVPPATAKERPVSQIDLVPTLTLLLGLPIPFNNLGLPIEEAFIGRDTDYANMAAVSRISAAQTHRYQAEYARARSLDDSATSPTVPLWQRANEAWQLAQASTKSSRATTSREAYEAYAAYATENLRIYRNLWARFDLTSMAMGISALTSVTIVIAMYSQGICGDRASLTPVLLVFGLVGTATGGIIGMALGLLPSTSFAQTSSMGATSGGILGTLTGLWPARKILKAPRPTTFWGGLCVLVTVVLCAGLGSNSFTIWEDEQLLFILSTFGVLLLGSSLGQADADDRFVGTVNSISFLAATRISSLSRLCREEQMPDCRSTYYASATSSTSAAWQLIIPFAVAGGLPTAITYFYMRTRNYQGSAVIWLGIAMRVGLVMVAGYWVLDAADDGAWFPSISKDLLKTSRIGVAQAVLALAFAAGYATYIMASPLLAVTEEAIDPATAPPAAPIDPMEPIFTPLHPEPQKPRTRITIYGYANAHGTRYFLLPCAWILALQLVQKPMGQGALALCTVSILNMLEIIDANSLRRSPVGPVIFALLGSYYFFKTGHQAALATIQWESAFIPLRAITYPWSPLLVGLNTFGAQILCALAVPAIAMWKVPPKQPGLLGRVAGAMATHMLFYAAIALATVIEAAWLRRHLMLYRVFMPRMLLAIAGVLMVEVVGTCVALVGLRWSIGSVGDVFGWPGT